MEYIDITTGYHPGMSRYPGTDDFTPEWLRHYSTGQAMALSRIALSSHLGTHIDAPYHFLESGRKIEDIPLETLCGPVQVVDATGQACVDEPLLEGVGIRQKRVLFKTDNSRRIREGAEFQPVYLAREACEYLVSRGVVLVGTDYYSVDRRGDSRRTAHLTLLYADVVILEHAELEQVPPGDYQLFCLPLKVTGLEGAPCRAVLLKGEDTV